MDEIAPEGIENAEAEVLARHLAAIYAPLFARYLREQELSQAAVQEQIVRGNRQLEGRPVENLSWWDLAALAHEDPALAASGWAQMKEAARQELLTGSRAAVAVEHQFDSAWKRVQFLVLRDSYIEEWRPQGGIELSLIDNMAQAQTEWLYWLERLHFYATCEGQTFDMRQAEQKGKWLPPRKDFSETMEQAAVMADRFNRLFLRTLRQLRDFRRYSAKVTIQNASQVNIAAHRGQQVNHVTATKAATDQVEMERESKGASTLNYEA